ncbi:MAG: YqeG family HAD IIIA-type phosphatase [Desulfuromonadaceae bacterium]
MPFPAHILAGFSLGFYHRRALRQLLDSTPFNSTILELDPRELQLTGVAALALDFDGVLAAHGSPAPLPESVVWMKQCENIFGGDRIFILSNKPTDERRQWFAEHFPAMRFISGVRKKPYPDGIRKSGELAGVPLSSILMVDDRLLTGCLAALVAGAHPCYIRRPFISFQYLPVAELFFWLLRGIERMYVRLAALF